jgi:hypothetical protein
VAAARASARGDGSIITGGSVGGANLKIRIETATMEKASNVPTLTCRDQEKQNTPACQGCVENTNKPWKSPAKYHSVVFNHAMQLLFPSKMQYN